MPGELIRPIDQETAKAIEETAKAAGKAFDLTGKAAGYLSDIVGTAPRNFVGYFIGDWLTHCRARNWARLNRRTREVLLESGAHEPFEEVSPAIAIPLIEAAIDEERPELAELWAKLLAAAHNPDLKKYVRRDIIETLKALEPLDAKVLETARHLANSGGTNKPLRNALNDLNVGSQIELDVAVQALAKLELINQSSASTWYLTAKAEMLLAAVR